MGIQEYTALYGRERAFPRHVALASLDVDIWTLARHANHLRERLPDLPPVVPYPGMQQMAISSRVAEELGASAALYVRRARPGVECTLVAGPGPKGFDRVTGHIEGPLESALESILRRAVELLAR
jgi:hypothetical protein